MLEHLIPQKRDLDDLMATLDVGVATVAESKISPGWRLKFPGSKFPSIHYDVEGYGQMYMGNAPPIPLSPHTMVITPPGQPFQIDTGYSHSGTSTLNVKEVSRSFAEHPSNVELFIAGDQEPALTLSSNYFWASYGTSVQLFGSMRAPIVERFGVESHLTDKMESITSELRSQHVGMEVMVNGLLKQVLVILFRRSLTSAGTWLDRFSMLSDPQMARALAAITAKPGASHSVSTLAETAGLSRSAFLARFNRSFQESPMT